MGPDPATANREPGGCRLSLLFSTSVSTVPVMTAVDLTYLTMMQCGFVLSVGTRTFTVQTTPISRGHGRSQAKGYPTTGIADPRIVSSRTETEAECE